MGRGHPKHHMRALEPRTLSDRYTILIADDHPICVEALTIAARAVPKRIDIKTAARISEIREAVTVQKFDVILLDLSLKDSDGLDTLMTVRNLAPSVPIGVVSGNENDNIMRQALALGARGFIPKSASLSEMTTALGVLLDGGAWFSASLYDAADDGHKNSPLTKLTRAQLRAKGQTNREIAHALGITEPTVKTHMSAVFKTLGVSSRSQAILAIKGG
jgi:DNA-binding NarL/FixJ family response regulator